MQEIEIILIDYISTCDDQKNLVGHSLPVIQQYYKLLSGVVRVSVSASRAYARHMIVEYPLPFNTSPYQKRGLLSAVGTLKKLLNLMLLPKWSPNRYFFLVNNDINVFLMALLWRRRFLSKCFLMQYEDFENCHKSWADRIKRSLFLRTVHLFRAIFVSNPQIFERPGLTNKYFLPDFVFLKEKYLPFIEQRKRENYCLVIGTLNKDKDIAGVIRAFRKSTVPLIIAGRFQGTKDEEKLIIQESMGGQIQLKFAPLTTKEYFQLIANALVVLLPYKEKSYHTRTSGVMLEALFLETPVIAPKFGFFERMLQKGIGYTYNNLEEVPQIISHTKECDWEKIRTILREVRNEYNPDSVRNTILSAMGIGIK